MGRLFLRRLALALRLDPVGLVLALRPDPVGLALALRLASMGRLFLRRLALALRPGPVGLVLALRLDPVATSPLPPGLPAEAADSAASGPTSSATSAMRRSDPGSGSSTRTADS